MGITLRDYSILFGDISSSFRSDWRVIIMVEVEINRFTQIEYTHQPKNAASLRPQLQEINQVRF